MDGSHIVTDPITGGQKGQKAARASDLDAKALLILAEVAGHGAEKYDKHNYLRGYSWSLSLDALHRHLWAFQSGEDNDPESGLPHMAHVAWHALALVSFQARGLGTDDRFKQERNRNEYAIPDYDPKLTEALETAWRPRVFVHPDQQGPMVAGDFSQVWGPPSETRKILGMEDA